MAAAEYWDYQLVQNYIYPRATFGEEPWASKLKARPDEPIPMFRREDIHVVVVGGETNGYWRIMGCNYQKTVSVEDKPRSFSSEVASRIPSSMSVRQMCRVVSRLKTYLSSSSAS